MTINCLRTTALLWGLGMMLGVLCRPAPADETHYRGGPGRTGDMGAVFGPAHIDNASSPVLFVVEAHPMRLTYSDDTVVDLPVQCQILALDALSGNTRWTIEPPGPVFRDFTLTSQRGAGLLIYFSWDQHYYLIDARTGTERWRFKDEGPAGSPAVIVHDGLVHTGAQALSLVTGREIWRRGDARNLFLPPTAFGSDLFGGGRALRTITGADLWTSPLPDEAITPPLLLPEVLVAGGADGRLYAFNPSSGESLWTLDIGAHIYMPAGQGEVVFVAARDRNLRALNANTGDELWNVTTAGGFDGTPVVADGRVFCRTREQFLFALDAASGSELWKFALEDEGPVPVDPAVGRGLVFTVTRRHVRALDAATGAVRWQREFEQPVDWAHPLLAN